MHNISPNLAHALVNVTLVIHRVLPVTEDRVDAILSPLMSSGWIADYKVEYAKVRMSSPAPVKGEFFEPGALLLSRMRARKALIDAFVENDEERAQNQPGWLHGLLESGFGGYESMSDAELVEHESNNPVSTERFGGALAVLSEADLST